MRPFSEIILILPRRGTGAETGGLGRVRGRSTGTVDGGGAAGAGAGAGAGAEPGAESRKGLKEVGLCGVSKVRQIVML